MKIRQIDEYAAFEPLYYQFAWKVFEIAYIVGVATAPEYRGRHLFAPLLETAFSVLRRQVRHLFY